MSDPLQLEIFPKIGLNVLKFGTTIDQAVGVFGQPEEQEEIKNELTNSGSLVYHYWEQGFSLFFNSNSKLTFTCAEIDNPNTIVFGERIFEMEQAQIIELFEKHHFPLSETEEHEWGEQRVSFDEALVDLYFENDALRSINFGLFTEESTFFYYPN